MEIKCSQCSAQLEAGAAFCNHCGAPIRCCSSCGAVAGPDTSFCSHCGNQLTTACSSAATSDPLATGEISMPSENNKKTNGEPTSWTLESRFLIRFGKQSIINADGPLLQIRKGAGFIVFGVRPITLSKPIQIYIPDISSITVNDSYSISAILMILLGLIGCFGEKFVAGLIFIAIGLSELRVRKISIIHQGQKTTVTDDQSKETVQSLVEYIRQYNPTCIQ